MPDRRHRHVHPEHVGERRPCDIGPAFGGDRTVGVGGAVARTEAGTSRRDQRIQAIIDDEKRGLPVSAYIAVTPTDYACESEIPGKLHNVDGIMSCDSVAGSPSYMLTVRAESPSKLEELLNVIHQTVPVSTETTIVLQRYFAK